MVFCYLVSFAPFVTRNMFRLKKCLGYFSIILIANQVFMSCNTIPKLYCHIFLILINFYIPFNHGNLKNTFKILILRNTFTCTSWVSTLAHDISFLFCKPFMELPRARTTPNFEAQLCRILFISHTFYHNIWHHYKPFQSFTFYHAYLLLYHPILRHCCVCI